MKDNQLQDKLEEIENELIAFDGDLEVKLYGYDISGQSIVEDIRWLVKTVKELKEDNDNLIDYKKAYYASRKAGVNLPYVKEI